jgi:hypothetical protein
VVRRITQAWKTVQALASMNMQIMLVRQLVAATGTVDADRHRVTQRLTVMLPTGHDTGGAWA